MLHGNLKHLIFCNCLLGCYYLGKDSKTINDSIRKSVNDMSDNLYFKYMSAKTAKIVLNTQTLRRSSPAQFNDIYDSDSKLLPNQELYEDEIIQQIQMLTAPHVIPESEIISALNEHYSSPEFQQDNEKILNTGDNDKALQEVLHSCAVLCLSKRKDHHRMWAQYASNHTGVVLAFRPSISHDSPLLLLKPVVYVSDKPKYDSLPDFRDKALHYKHKDWEHESEYRVFEVDACKDAPYRDFPFYKEELISIYLGVRISVRNKNKIIRLAREYPALRLYQTKKSRLSYELLFESI